MIKRDFLITIVRKKLGDGDHPLVTGVEKREKESFVEAKLS